MRQIRGGRRKKVSNRSFSEIHAESRDHKLAWTALLCHLGREDVSLACEVEGTLPRVIETALWLPITIREQ
jgi:hypothetical protein